MEALKHMFRKRSMFKAQVDQMLFIHKAGVHVYSRNGYNLYMDIDTLYL